MTTTNRRTPIPMPDDMRSALQRVADADGRSMAYVAREAIAALLDGREPGWRAGREPVASSGAPGDIYDMDKAHGVMLWRERRLAALPPVYWDERPQVIARITRHGSTVAYSWGEE